MSNQEPHATLLIPGPIEFDDEVLKTMSHFRYLPHLSIGYSKTLADMTTK